MLSGDSLRPAFDKPVENELTKLISKLAYIHKNSKAICYGGYKNLIVTNKQLVFERSCDDERIIVAINADSNEYRVNLDNSGTSLLTGQQLENNFILPAYSAECIRM